MTRRLRAAASPVYLALLLILAVGLVLRVLHNTYGLPYVYNIDEGSHFTNRAVGMFGVLDPGTPLPPSRQARPNLPGARHGQPCRRPAFRVQPSPCLRRSPRA